MSLTAWLVPTTRRVYPADTARRAPPPALRAPRAGRCSVQAAFILAGDAPCEVACRVDAPGLTVRVRRVGHVPQPHANTQTPDQFRDGVGLVPGFVPDPLFEETVATFAPHQANAFWIGFAAAADARPGRHQATITLSAKDQPDVVLAVAIEVADLVLAPRRGFPVTHWFHFDCLADRYGIEPWSEAYWPLAEKYVRNYVEHGSDTLYVPVFTPPLDGVRKPEVQLLGVSRGADGGWRFDWSRVERWIALARGCGVRGFEWSHLFTQWGCERALRIYDRSSGTPTLCWPVETGATSPTYRGFLAAYLPELKRFIDRLGIADASFFHVSDEPHGNHLPNYRAARTMLRELAPWMSVMDALSDVEFGIEGVVDLPIPVLSSAPAFAKAGVEAWTYYCCWPRGGFLNRLLDTPLQAIAMHGFLFHRLRAQGFLHWGFNYWYRAQTTESVDPFQVTNGARYPDWAYGDPFVVYPGKDGPIDSLRWEVFAEALQDLAVLRQLGVDHADPTLAAIRAYDDFPRDDAWLARAREELLARAPRVAVATG